MLKNKIVYIRYLLCLIMAMVLITGCNKAKPDIDSESQKLLEEVLKEESALLVEDAEPILNLSEVHKGDFIVSKTHIVNFYYPNTEIIRYDNQNMKATFVEFLCALGDEVKEGDPLFSIEYHVNLLEYEKAKLDLLRTVEAYEAGREEKEQQLQQEAEKLDRIDDPIEEIKQSFQVEYLKDDLDNYITTMEKNIDDLREKVSEFESMMGTINITSPIDGYVTYMNLVYPGDELNFLDEILTLVNYDEVYLLVDNSSNNFRYNMEVDLIAKEKTNTIQFNKETKKPPTNEKKYKGRVVSGDNLVTNDLKSNQVIIELIDADIKDIVNMDVKATCYPFSVKNSLLVSNNAVMFEGREGKLNVRVHENGNTYKKYFIGLGRDNDNWLIFDGLDEGMEVLLK
ncbi:MAG: hypothetical protein GX288_08365 [Clostridiales bacterium]|nr:hypothetical protein [Clostridiales bacterium]